MAEQSEGHPHSSAPFHTRHKQSSHGSPPQPSHTVLGAHSFLDVSFAGSVQVIHNFLQCFNSLSQLIFLPLWDNSSGQCLQNRGGERELEVSVSMAGDAALHS